MLKGKHTEHIAFFFFARVLPHITLCNVFCCHFFFCKMKNTIANHTQFIRCIYLVICQDLQQVMVSGPNLNETSIVSGGYGGPAGGIIPTSSIKGTVRNFRLLASRALSYSSFFKQTLYSLYSLFFRRRLPHFRYIQ